MRIVTIAIVLGSMAKLALAQTATPAVDGAAPPAPTPAAVPVAMPTAVPIPVAVPMPTVVPTDAAQPVPMQAADDGVRPQPVPAASDVSGASSTSSNGAPQVIVNNNASVLNAVSIDEDDDDGDKDAKDPKKRWRKRRRPMGYSVGLGLGYTLPADLKSPNTASVRFRFYRGLTIEPAVVMESATVRRNDAGVEQNDSLTTFAFGATGRWPLRMRGRVDLVAVGGFSYATSTDNPDGPNNVASAHTTSLSWGLGLDYWINKNWAISGTAVNPLLQYSKIRTEEVGSENEDTGTAFGAVWDPRLTFMLHMFY
jgi:hypothetical protein